MRTLGSRLNLSPVVSAIAASIMIMLGILVVVYPQILAWAVGIALVAGGVGLLTAGVINAGAGEEVSE